MNKQRLALVRRWKYPGKRVLSKVLAYSRNFSEKRFTPILCEDSITKRSFLSL